MRQGTGKNNMAGDWIKMRVSLPRDPHVIEMTQWLLKKPEFIEWLGISVKNSNVTRNVTSSLCVTALLVTWGIARERGDRNGMDLILDHCDLATLSVISDIPFFGEAMAFTNWAKEGENGVLIFPNFFKDNESPDERHKRQNSERQANFRVKKNKSKNSNVTVTQGVTLLSRTEKRRVEKSTKPPISPKGDCDRVYSAYPRKVGKAKALAAIEKALKLIPFAELLPIVESFAKAVQGRESRFVPHPATWFGQQRWLDDQSEWYDGKTIKTQGRTISVRKKAIWEDECDAVISEIRTVRDMPTLDSPKFREMVKAKIKALPAEAWEGLLVETRKLLEEYSN
jgi:hypothetical protein